MLCLAFAKQLHLYRAVAPVCFRLFGLTGIKKIPVLTPKFALDKQIFKGATYMPG